MDRVNPVYIPRNHRVEEALAKATEGELAPFHQLVDIVSSPFDERPGGLHRSGLYGRRPVRHLLRHLSMSPTMLTADRAAYSARFAQ